MPGYIKLFYHPELFGKRFSFNCHSTIGKSKQGPVPKRVRASTQTINANDYVAALSPKD